jgi:valyl-tRNA synthetase
MWEKNFNPSEAEPRIYEAWEKAGAFKAGREDRKNAEAFSIVIPPPNVTGSLHIGHALNNTLQDILCRYQRMRGKDVLWQPGMDHAGIATQMVVERKLYEENKTTRQAMGREAFLKEVWKWKEESGGTILRQLRRLGASCDWSRARFTMDEDMSRAVTEFFVRLHEAGLIYKDKRLVNWDVKFQTAISDLEVVQKEIRGNLYYIKYPLAGDVLQSIIVATTRPETMLGDVAIAVHPDDERYKKLVGKKAVLPLVGREIPIIADEYSDPEKGTGAVKITPAHDFNDFEVAKRHGLTMINVLSAAGKMALDHNDLENMRSYDGLDRFEARKQIVALLEEQGLIEKIEPYTHTVPHGDRSNVAVEPRLTEQWYVNVRPLADKALAAVRANVTNFIPEHWTKTFYQWLENIQPWCVSRQLWWGHQIPAWYGPDGHVFVARDEDAVAAAALAHYTMNGEISAAAGHDIAADTLLRAKFVREYLKRDEDVLDTWFSSALWPMATLGWPKDTPELKRYFPTSTLITAHDIIFFWVARMMMASEFIKETVPFRDVYIHPLVRDEKGAKMSKSKGNIVDPLSIMDEYGADALRFTLASLAVQGRDIKLSNQRIEGSRNFGTKLWNAGRFLSMNGCFRREGFDLRKVKETLSLWILSELNATVVTVTAAIEDYRFNEAANAIYHFVWGTFCDWYVEFAKPILQDEEKDKAETQATAAYVYDEAVKLLHPFMPFMTEELWRVTGAKGPKREALLTLSAWPQPLKIAGEKAAQEINWLIGCITSIRALRSEMNVPAATQVPLVFSGEADEARAYLKNNEALLKKLARIAAISFEKRPPREAARFVIGKAVAALPLADIIDLSAERARLAKEAEKLAQDMAKIEAKLSNPEFATNAPEDVVEEQKERKADVMLRQSKIKEALQALR